MGTLQKAPQDCLPWFCWSALGPAVVWRGEAKPDRKSWFRVDLFFIGGDVPYGREVEEVLWSSEESLGGDKSREVFPRDSLGMRFPP